MSTLRRLKDRNTTYAPHVTLRRGQHLPVVCGYCVANNGILSMAGIHVKYSYNIRVYNHVESRLQIISKRRFVYKKKMLPQVDVFSRAGVCWQPQ